ncbi:putative non-specific serine/threonine protein kinase [Helianthus anomalus]
MTKLRYLHLSTNSLSGDIPMFIGSMTRLRYLDLSTNFFNGSIPMFIGSMTRLRYLDLSYNSFSGLGYPFPYSLVLIVEDPMQNV